MESMDRQVELHIVKKPAWLLGHSLNIYSQSGEDGILEKIIEMLPEIDKWCVEFGAADGIWCSNTRNLILKQNYSAVLIESNKEAYEKLTENYKSNKKVKSLYDIVGFNGVQTLDYILYTKSHVFIPTNFDLLSMDVDGNEYHIWKSMEIFKPKVICAEYNYNIPTEVRFIQKADIRVNVGSSLQSMIDLGKEKGYELICVTEFNAIFVRKEYYRLFEIYDNSPYLLRKDTSHIMWIFPGYNGQMFLRGNTHLHEHCLDLRERDVQVLPKYLQRWAANYNIIQRWLFAWHLLWHNPIKLWDIIKGKFSGII